MAQANAQPQGTSQQSQPEGRGFGRRLAEGFEAFWKTPQEMAPRGQQQQRQQQSNDNAGSTLEELDANGKPIQKQGNGQPKAPDPLAAYDGIWDNSPQVDKDGKPIDNSPPKFAIDPTKIGEAASKINFGEGLPEELAEKMQTGQSLSAQDQQTLLNHAGQRAYAVAMQHMTGLTDRYVDIRMQHEQKGLDQKFQTYLSKSKVLSHDAVKNNPKLAAHLEHFSTQLAAKNPDKSADWIADQTVQYFQDMGQAFGMVPASEAEETRRQAPTTTKNGETVRGDGKVFDWAGYLKD